MPQENLNNRKSSGEREIRTLETFHQKKLLFRYGVL